jgi:LysR family hydrogen peroxide-inducible transcriptional activator
MTLTQIHYVLAVAELGHFGKASERCAVTQPTLSAQIQKLEEEIGLKIFARNTHPIQPTEAGKLLIDRMQEVQRAMRGLEAGVEELNGLFKGEFRLGLIPTLAPALLPRMLPHLRKELPLATFHFSELTTDALLSALRERKLDAALVAGPLAERGMREVPLFYEPFVAYVPQGHRLSDNDFVLHSELNSSELLLLGEGHCFRNSVLRLCGESKDVRSAIPGMSLETGSFSVLIRLAQLGYGMTLLPWLVAADLPKGDQKALKPLDHPIPTRQISLVFPEDRYRRGVMDTLAEAVRRSVPERMLEAAGAPVSPF